MSKETGGPAFPHIGIGTDEEGMTMRDYFAAKAVQGLLARTDYKGPEDDYAKVAYKLADAMLKARQQ